jgi:hypothetical protein
VSTTTADIGAYASRVRLALSDLPASSRDDLAADLEDHLAEVAAEGELPELLGTPEAYAAELRSSAGLPPRGPAQRAPAPEWVRATRDYLAELRPAWWLLRGVLVGAALGVVLGTLPAVLLLAVAGAAGSVALGQRARRRPGLRPADAAASGLAAVVAVVAVLGAVVSGGSSEPAPADYSVFGGLTDLVPYSSDGTPLEGVRLYDQNGEPVQLGSEGNVYPKRPGAAVPPTPSPSPR